MALSYDLFWSFRSSYSYLLTKRLVTLEPDFYVFRCADFLGLPLKWLTLDPAVTDFGTRTYPCEQSYIYRISQRGQLAAGRAGGLILHGWSAMSAPHSLISRRKKRREERVCEQVSRIIAVQRVNLPCPCVVGGSAICIGVADCLEHCGIAPRTTRLGIGPAL